MKIKIITIIALNFFIINSYSQEKGQKILGGSVYVHADNRSDSRMNTESSDVNLLPTIGYMISDKVALGCSFGYDHYKYNTEQNSVETAYSREYITISPYVQFYNPIAENFLFYIQLSIGTKFGLKGDTDNPSYTFYGGGSAGLMYFISKKISLELSIASINYSYRSDKDNNEKAHSFALQNDLTRLPISLKYYF